MPEAPAQVVLAFDFGLRRIGIASGDTISRTAAPQGAVTVAAHGIEWTPIDRALKDFKPNLLVVGSPHNADGSAGSLSEAADRFAAALAQRSCLPVKRTDEYASSLEAAAELKSQRASGQRRRRVQRADIDSAAAAIILERWLNREIRAGAGNETCGDD
jgi:putative holliday junction resolvase